MADEKAEGKPASMKNTLIVLAAAILLICLVGGSNRGCSCTVLQQASDRAWNDLQEIHAKVPNHGSKSLTLYVDGETHIIPPHSSHRVRFVLHPCSDGKKYVTGMRNGTPFTIYLQKTGIFSMDGWMTNEKPEFEFPQEVKNPVAEKSAEKSAGSSGTSDSTSSGDSAKNTSADGDYDITFTYRNPDPEHERIIHTSYGAQSVSPGATVRLRTRVGPLDQTATVELEDETGKRVPREIPILGK
jgi:hypothetical protein